MTTRANQERSADVSRKRVLEAARAVFRAEGFAGARTRDIAIKADVKESRLWTLFQSKEELFAVAVLDALESHVADMLGREDLRSAEGDESRANVFEKTQARWLSVMDEIIPLLGVAMFSSPESGAAFYRDRLVPLFEQTLEGSREGFRRWPPLMEDEWTSFLFLWGAHFGVALDAYIRGEHLDVSTAAHQIAELLYHGAVA